MTFIQFLNWIPKEFDNQEVNLSIITLCSKIIKSGTDLIISLNKKIDFNPKHCLNKLADYYCNNKPLAQITHETKFNGYKFIVNNYVHCPRNETELLAKTISIIMMNDSNLNKVLDICAGTGNLGISIKLNHKYINLSLLEIYKPAIRNINANIELHNIKANVIKVDFFKFIKTNKEKFNVIIMNPPYVDKKELDSKIIKYENIMSFNNSINPLAFYKELLNSLNHLINQDHFLIGCEFGYNQKQQIKKLIKNAGYIQYTTFYKDLNNLDRYFIIYKK